MRESDQGVSISPRGEDKVGVRAVSLGEESLKRQLATPPRTV
jgi:hypothetical protein